MCVCVYLLLLLLLWLLWLLLLLLSNTYIYIWYMCNIYIYSCCFAHRLFRSFKVICKITFAIAGPGRDGPNQRVRQFAAAKYNCVRPGWTQGWFPSYPTWSTVTITVRTILKKTLVRNELSSFVINISMYLCTYVLTTVVLNICLYVAES